MPQFKHGFSRSAVRAGCEANPKRRNVMDEESAEQPTDEAAAEAASGRTDEGGDNEGGAGPPDDIENDPAYDPDDPELKGIKGG
jgi:hypothetical protein